MIATVCDMAALLTALVFRWIGVIACLDLAYHVTAERCSGREGCGKLLIVVLQAAWRINCQYPCRLGVWVSECMRNPNGNKDGCSGARLDDVRIKLKLNRTFQHIKGMLKHAMDMRRWAGKLRRKRILGQ